MGFSGPTPVEYVSSAAAEAARKKQQAFIDACMQRKTGMKPTGQSPSPINDILGSLDDIPVPWLVAGGLGLILIVVLATRR